MGRGFGVLARVCGIGLLVILAAPVVALGPAMVVDRGWDGAARVSAFPPALVVLDPLVWRCVRNSVAVALAVTVGSLGMGVGLGLILGRRRFWGRVLLGGLAVVPLAIGPIWLAPGVLGWIGGESSWAWLAARSFLGQPGDEWARWLALVWVGVAGGAPRVILETQRGLARVDTAWADAARVVGAGRFRVWSDVTWPTIRPGLARVAGSVFTWTLIEPAGPILLGLRRTLAVETADAAIRLGEPNRAVALAMIAVVGSVLVRSGFRRWGGTDLNPVGDRPSPPVQPRAHARLGAFATFTLIAWATFAIGPAVTFARRLATATLGDRAFDRDTARAILAEWLTPELIGWTVNSALTATLAVGLGLVVRAALGRGRLARSLGGFAAVPPLAIGVGALAIPSLLSAWAAWAGRPGLVVGLELVRVELSPGRSPGFLLILVLAAVHLNWLGGSSRAADLASARDRADAALLVGASPRLASRLARSRAGDRLGRRIILAWTWAGTDLAAAWVLTTLSERRTIAPVALGLVGDGQDPLDPRLSALFVVTIGIRLVGVAALVGLTRGKN